tara:strand:+ start:1172 stop:1492 length:321 start_codon:yes stop_codon:yes gene_type:complete
MLVQTDCLCAAGATGLVSVSPLPQLIEIGNLHRGRLELDPLAIVTEAALDKPLGFRGEFVLGQSGGVNLILGNRFRGPCEAVVEPPKTYTAYTSAAWRVRTTTIQP